MGERLYVGIAVLDYNGDILGDAVLVEGGVIRGVGPVDRFKGRRRVEVDGYILPGFIDAHMHVEELGVSLLTADLRGARSPEEVAKRLASLHGPVALGRGWDEESFVSGGVLTRQVLDRFIPDRPALAIRICGHVAVANTAALKAVRPWERYPRLVDREKGLLLEDAVYMASRALRKWIDPVEAVRQATREMVRLGVYGAASMACGSREARALAELEERDELPVRVSCYASKEEWRELVGGSGRNWAVVGVKLFADGSLGGRTAWLRGEYGDKPGWRGVSLLSRREIVENALEAFAAGLKVAVHAIGDAALAEVVEAYEELGGGPRLRVEHASVAEDGDISRLASLGVWVVVQPRFRVSDWWIEKRLGSRAQLAYRFRTMLDRGTRIALSTDAPVEPLDPAETLRAAAGLCNQPACREEESLRPREALQLYTREAALAAGGPVAMLGVIARGAPAALAAASKDPTSLASLKNLRVWGLTP